MSWIWTTPGGWLFRSVIGGGILLLMTWALMRRTRQPARRQRLGEWGIGIALLLAILNLGPAWIPVVELASQHNADLRSATKPPSPSLMTENPHKERGASSTQSRPKFAAKPIDRDSGQAGDLFVSEDQPAALEIPSMNEGYLRASALATREDGKLLASPTEKMSAPTATNSESHSQLFLPSAQSIISWVCLAYAVVATILLGRWLLGYVALKRLLSAAEPAPPQVRRIFADIAGRGRRPRLLVSSRLRVPLSCGLIRPTIVIPATLLRGLTLPAQEGRLRWVLAHELTHLRRRDAWSCLLFGLGQGLYFFWPWFWWLRRQVRLCQEYMADAAVVRMAGSAEDYAEFLLSMSSAPAVPVSATGVMGNSSDLFRRVTMLLKTPKRMERTVSWRWTLATAGGLLAVAILASGIGPRAVAKAAPDTVKAAAPATDKTAPKDEDQDGPKAPQPPQPPGAAPFGGFRFEDFNDPKTMEEMIQRMQGGAGMAGGFFGGQGRLGVRVSVPSAALADQLDLPKDQGLVIDQVTPESAAAKGGLKNNDILLEFNGKPVPKSIQEFVRSMHEIKADTKVDAVVLRKGKKETIKGLSLPEEKQVGAAAGGFGGMPPGGGFPGSGGLKGGGFGGNQPGMGGFGRGFGAGQPGAPGMMGFAGPNTVMTTMYRTDNNYTTRHQEGSLIITVTGTVSDGKAKTNKIHVQDGQVSHEYESLDKVPDQYKDKVKNLVEMSEKGSVKIEIKTPEAKPEANSEPKK
jgi:beta-lactamase regulating signal transducer with metallopeptidase domain